MKVNSLASIILLIVFFNIAKPAFSQTDSDAIKQADDLIARKKYESAFQLLHDYDPGNDNPDIVLLEEDIALNYFITSMMHQMFAFKDLKANEDIMDYRGKEGSFPMYDFPVDKILDSLITIYPDNYKLYNGLGNFYYDVYLKYGGNWLKASEELLSLSEQNYRKAVDHNAGDYLSYYTLGYIAISKKNYKEGISDFLKSIELNPHYASSYYNLAYAYLYMDDRENALKYGKKSFELYKDSSYKADAARMIGVTYGELKDDKNALYYYEQSNQIDPNNFHTLNPLLDLYVKTNNPKAGATREQFFSLEPENPTVYNELTEIYYSHGKESDLIKFFADKTKDYPNNPKVLGSLYFYTARLYLSGGNNGLAKENFLKAKDQFSLIFEKDNEVFTVINDQLKKMK